MKTVITYFDRWAEGWYEVNRNFASEAAAREFLDNPRAWPSDVDSRALGRAIHDGNVQITQRP